MHLRKVPGYAPPIYQANHPLFSSCSCTPIAILPVKKKVHTFPTGTTSIVFSNYSDLFPTILVALKGGARKVIRPKMPLIQVYAFWMVRHHLKFFFQKI